MQMFQLVCCALKRSGQLLPAKTPSKGPLGALWSPCLLVDASIFLCILVVFLPDLAFRVGRRVIGPSLILSAYLVVLLSSSLCL